MLKVIYMRAQEVNMFELQAQVKFCERITKWLLVYISMAREHKGTGDKTVVANSVFYEHACDVMQA